VLNKNYKPRLRLKREGKNKRHFRRSKKFHRRSLRRRKK
jgi:hypothetical protein